MKASYTHIVKEFFLVTTAVVLGSLPIMAQTSEVKSDTASLQELMNVQFGDEQLRKDMDNTNVVSASKNRENIATAPGVMTVVERVDIQAFGANSLVEVLDRVTGMYVTGSYYFPENLAVIRGDVQTHTTSHVLILLDGRPCRESFYGGVDLAVFNSFPLEAIERIEIIRGPGSVLYGTNAYSGVINLITRKEQKTTTQITTKAGMFGTSGISAHQSIIGKELSIHANGQYFNQKGWQFNATDSKGVNRTILYGQRNLGANLTASYRHWTFKGFYGDSHRNIFGDRPIWFADPVSNDLKIHRAFADLGYQHNFSKQWYVTLNATYNGFSNRSIRDEKPVHFFSNDLLVEMTQFIHPVEGLNVVVGALANYVTGEGVQVDQQENAQLVKRYGEVRWAAYSQLDYRPFASLKLIAGAQVNRTPGVVADVVPRLGAILNFTPDFGTKALYGQAYKSAAQSEKYSNIPNVLYGNPALLPEKVGTLDIQLFLQKPSYQLTGGYFLSHQHNTVQRQPLASNPAANIYVNQGSLMFQGVELEVRALPVQRMILTGSLTYQTSVNNQHVHDPGTISNWMAKGGVTYSLKNGLEVGLFNSYFSKPADVINTQVGFASEKQRKLVNPVPQAFNLMSLNVLLNLTKLLRIEKFPALSLNGYVYNLLDERVDNPEFSRRNINSVPAMSGRAIYGGLTIKF